MSQSMNVDIIRIATKRVVVGMSAKDDNTDIVLAKMNAIRKANQAKIDRAKRNARLRKEQALLKKMAAFFREKDDGSNFVHPLDLMNKTMSHLKCSLFERCTLKQPDCRFNVPISILLLLNWAKFSFLSDWKSGSEELLDDRITC